MTQTEQVPQVGGGMPVIQYWAQKTLLPTGVKLWQTVNHHSACLSCAWGTGGQKGGFVNEDGETLANNLGQAQRALSKIKTFIYVATKPNLDLVRENMP